MNDKIADAILTELKYSNSLKLLELRYMLARLRLTSDDCMTSDWIKNQERVLSKINSTISGDKDV